MKKMLIIIFTISPLFTLAMETQEIEIQQKKEIKRVEDREKAIQREKEEGPLKQILPRLTDASYYDFAKERRADINSVGTEKLKAALGINDLGSWFESGYIFFNSDLLMKGKRAATEELWSERLYHALAQQYKIHLMPKTSNDMALVLEYFLKELKTNQKLQDSINLIKIKPYINFFKPKEEIIEQLTSKHYHLEKQTEVEEIVPLIVIYPADGKDKAQYVLDIIYNQFKNIEGLDVSPRYNEKITSLIYYLQGDGGSRQTLSNSFSSDEVVYRPNFEGPGLNIDYHLKNPAKAKLRRKKKSKDIIMRGTAKSKTLQQQILKNKPPCPKQKKTVKKRREKVQKGKEEAEPITGKIKKKK